MLTSKNLHSIFTLRFLLLLGCTSLLLIEALFLSQTFDAYVLVQAGGNNWWQTLFGHLGKVSRWGLTFSALLMVILYPRLAEYWQKLMSAFRPKRALALGAAQLVCFTILLLLTNAIFRSDNVHSTPPSWYGAWVLMALASGLLWLLMLVPMANALRVAKREKWGIVIAGVTATVVTLIAFWSNTLWGPLAEATFYISAFVLAILGTGEVSISPEERIIGLNDFWINIAPVCSGYEGMGLVCAFIAVYMLLYRRTTRFPQAFLLFPLGIFAIWVLNIFRIVTLVIIGAHWSADIAIGGFHSFGGWIAFLLVSLLILKIASSSRWFATPLKELSASNRSMNTETAVLVPFVVLMATTIGTAALSAGFDWLYPIRVVAVATAILTLRQFYPLKAYRPQWEAILVGIAIAILWFYLVPQNPEYDAGFTSKLENAAPMASYIWIAIRFLGACITVPIAEELAFRGYLLAKLSKQDRVVLNQAIPFNVVGFMASSLAFGLLHGHWTAGIVAGAGYAWVRYRARHIGGAIWAHTITNFCLFGAAVATGRWVLL